MDTKLIWEIPMHQVKPGIIDGYPKKRLACHMEGAS